MAQYKKSGAVAKKKLAIPNGAEKTPQIARLEEEVKSLELQCALFRENFDFKKVGVLYKWVDNDTLMAMLVDENRKLNHRVQELESEKNVKMDSSTQNSSDSLDVEEKLNKQTQAQDKNDENKQGKPSGASNTSTRNYKQELDMANTEISELKFRLSAIQLKQAGNPDIDFSDPNRPTKLAERYAELFNDEWTDAYEEIEQNGFKLKEEDIIQRLLETVKDIYKLCQDISKENERGIKISALAIPGSKKERSKEPQYSASSRQKMVELRKTLAPALIDDVFQQYMKSLRQPLDKYPRTKQFVKKCVEIFWMMSMHDPPMVLDIEDPKGTFDTCKYKPYTRSGKTYDYIVWPPILLHEAGALLGKGFAQGKKIEASK